MKGLLNAGLASFVSIMKKIMLSILLKLLEMHHTQFTYEKKRAKINVSRKGIS